jgi:hypothetical protein
MKVKMLSRNPDNYVRETKFDLQRGEAGKERLPRLLGSGLSFYRAKVGGGQRSSRVLYQFQHRVVV